MATLYSESDGNLDHLRDLPIGVIGYGNQGRAHALNLRDSGLIIKVGCRPGGKAEEQAIADGFKAESVEQVAANCSVLAILLPDEVVPSVYQNSIAPYLQARPAFVFAHGFVVRHKCITLPSDSDVILVAPTGPGRQVRSLFQEGLGLPALLAVQQDVSGVAWQRCLAYAKALGCLRAGGLRTTFEEETVTDLYCEQSVLCGGLPELIKASFDQLVARGYQPELAYISCLKEVKLIADLLFTRGIDGMRSAISNTAKFGSAVAGPRLVDQSTVRALDNLLTEIENGSFAKSFLSDHENGSPAIRQMMTSEKHSRLAQTGRWLSENLRF